MFRRFILVLIFLSIIFSLPACKQKTTDMKLIVAVSIVPQATFVKAVAGDLIDVVTMIPPGNSPGNYEPSPRELTKFSDASIYFSIGVPADLANILPAAREFNPKIKIVKLFKEVNSVYRDREFATDSRDPHIWLSPKRVRVMVDVIARELSIIDKKNEETYRRNARKYKSRLDQLDREIRNSLKGIKSKTFIVYHPSFAYFAEEYGLKMMAIEEGGKEAPPRRLQEIIDKAEKENIKVVFYQEEVDSKQSEVIAREIGGKTVQVDPLAAEYIENLRNISRLLSDTLK